MKHLPVILAMLLSTTALAEGFNRAGDSEG
jgi:hypothetical protein